MKTSDVIHRNKSLKKKTLHNTPILNAHSSTVVMYIKKAWKIYITFVIHQFFTHPMMAQGWAESTWEITNYLIYPTPPLGQDMTQGQFLSGV